MGLGAGQVAGLVKFGIVFEAVLDGADDDGPRVDLPVGFRHDAAVEGTGRGLGGGTVVFDGFFHRLELFRREILGEDGIGQQDLARVDMVVLPAVDDAQVVVGSDDVDHVAVHVDTLRRKLLGQGLALTDHGRDVVELVCLVEMRVTREDFRLDVGFQRGIHGKQAWLIGRPA